MKCILSPGRHHCRAATVYTYTPESGHISCLELHVRTQTILSHLRVMRCALTAAGDAKITRISFNWHCHPYISR